jgi:hypothetical protein
LMALGEATWKGQQLRYPHGKGWYKWWAVFQQRLWTDHDFESQVL